MENKNYLTYLVEEIHTTVVATVDDAGLPVTAAIDMMDADENGIYFLTARGKGFYDRLKKNGVLALTGMKGEDKPMTMNLRLDDTFVEDEGWHRAAERYKNYLRTHESQKILFLELGVGFNTPVIIKYPFWQLTVKNPNATYACINQGQAVCPQEIEKQAICINSGIDSLL